MGRGGHYDRIFTAEYGEGAEVGYKWFATWGEAPLFPFGYGLSTMRFDLGSVLAFGNGPSMMADVSVRNAGDRASTVAPQFYLNGPGFGPWLAGWARINLQPGEKGHAAITVDPCVAAHFDEAAGRWCIVPGTDRITAGLAGW